LSSEIRSRVLASIWVVALVVGFALRAVPLTAARPYIAYVDEGNFLHPAARLLRDGGWDPRWYLYPQFPTIVAVAAMRLYAPVYGAVHGRPLRDRISHGVELYDDLEPFDLLLIGRGVSLVLGLLMIVLTGLFARRLGGPVAGATAALLAAVTPALVLRGSIATVDPYATLFALACLYLTDVKRTSARPGLISFLAGLMGGVAFASKYPSVVVMIAFGLTTVLQRIDWREKLRRLLLGASGLALGAALAMPAVVLHTREVYDAIRNQATAYGQTTSVPLWQQAFRRAEWDIRYERPELGVVLVLLALGGLIVSLRDRKAASTIWGWCGFAAVSLVMYGRQSFQPFRNLLPLVPLACIAASLFFVWLRSRLSRPFWADAVAVLWIAVAFVVPLARYSRERLHLRDTRVEAVDWLAAHARPEDEVLFIRELGILSQERDRLPTRNEASWWDQAAAAIRERRPRFVVAGVLDRLGAPSVDVAALPEVRSAYVPRFRQGFRPTVGVNSWWRDNDQIVVVLERKD